MRRRADEGWQDDGDVSTIMPPPRPAIVLFDSGTLNALASCCAALKSFQLVFDSRRGTFLNSSWFAFVHNFTFFVELVFSVISFAVFVSFFFFYANVRFDLLCQKNIQTKNKSEMTENEVLHNFILFSPFLKKIHHKSS